MKMSKAQIKRNNKQSNSKHQSDNNNKSSSSNINIHSNSNKNNNNSNKNNNNNKSVTQYTAATANVTAATNQSSPTAMATASGRDAAAVPAAATQSALGYSNGILYLEHDTHVTYAAQHYNNNNMHMYGSNNNNKNLVGAVVGANVIVREDAIAGAALNVVAVVAAADDAADANDDDNDNDDAESASFASSMETLSDNVSIWVDGEKQWISGVDAQTTCADLICAVLNYQNRQQLFDAAAGNERSASNNNNSSNNNSSGSNSNSNKTANTVINQSTANTKEDCKAAISSSSSSTPPVAAATLTAAPATGPSPTAIAALLRDYVIVKQHRHCEEYLDGSTKVLDVLPARDMPGGKECELLLRRLAPSPHITQVSSLLSTDKDSGMGSPVGSSRSARFRRRKHKSATWLAQANTLHPKLAHRSRSCAANERLLKIILAQDETIHRQLSLLREKERQISRIEEEKHRKRERELGKNYLLETYLNGLEEADVAPEELEKGVQILIDEPYQRPPAAAAAAAPPKTSSKHKSAERKDKRKQRKDKAAKEPHGASAGSEPCTLPDAASPTPAATSNTAGTPQQEIELQLLWLEKVYALNKRLQREEEQLLKLHTKLRKHAVKRACHTRTEVLQQIDQLDAALALKYVETRQVEERLLTSNDELQQKLCLLEQLSQQMRQTEQPAAAEATAERTDMASNNMTAVSPQEQRQRQQQQQQIDLISEAPLSQPPALPLISSTRGTAADASSAAEMPAHKLQLNNVLYSPADLLQLQKLIAKPTAAAAAQQAAANSLPQQQQQLPLPLQPASNYAINSLHHNCDSASSIVPATVAATASTATFAFASITATADAPCASYCTPQQLIDKNTLPSHVHNVKTVKKQMFGPKSLHQQQQQQAACHGGQSEQAGVFVAPAANATAPAPATAAAASACDMSVDITQLGTLV